MNENDSERIASFLDKNGLKKTKEENADIIIVNSCSIRQSSVDRVLSKLKKTKESGKTVVLTGCVLKKDRERAQKIADYTFPPNDFLSWSTAPFVSLKCKNYFDVAPKRKGISANISITTGCDNFCSYCVVPYVKGKEKSRPAEEIIKEAEEAVKDGYKEIWLLGQNVNSFDGGIKFSELLTKISKIRGDFWIRFTSSHPKDFSEDTVLAMKASKKITNYLNLPVQSGDNEILKKMNRPYTVSQYKLIVNEIKKHLPEIFLSTDIIVGFPGEAEKNFRNTVKLVTEMEFDMIYIGKYSPRLQTAAYNLEDTVSQEEKVRREKILTELLKESNLKKNKKYVGKKEKVLVAGKNKKGFLFGKTENYKNIIFKGPQKLIGGFANIKVENYSSWGLKGKICQK